MKYTKRKAIHAAKYFLAEVHQLEKRYGMNFNSDSGDIYLTFKTTEKATLAFSDWGHINIGWVGDGTGLQVVDSDIDEIREAALSKLTDEECEALGIER